MAQPANSRQATHGSQHSTPGDSRQLSEVQALRLELADTQKKLQGYADTVVSLHTELRALRENICKTCKENFVPNMTALASEVAGATVGSTSRSHFVPEATNRECGSTASNKHVDSISPDTVHVSHIPVILPSSVSGPLSISPIKVIEPKVDPIDIAFQWTIKRDELASVDMTLKSIFIHKYPVRSVQFSPDGKYLAALLQGNWKEQCGETFVYNVETGEKNCVLGEYSSKYSSNRNPGKRCLCFSPNGRYLVVGDMTGHITVWDIPMKRIRNMFGGHHSFVLSVNFSPNGRYVVSASPDRTVRIWNVRDGSMRVFNDGVFWFARFSPDGQHVVTGDTGGVMTIWNVRTGQQVRRWTGHKDTVRSMAFRLDGMRLLSGSDNGELKYWDISSLGIVQSGGEPEFLEYGCSSTDVYCVAISPDARWIAAASYHDRTVVLWDTRNAIRQCTLTGPNSFYSVDFSPTGIYLATSTKKGHVMIWKIQT